MKYDLVDVWRVHEHRLQNPDYALNWEELKFISSFIEFVDPDIVIESGTHEGWSALHFANLMGNVITFDPVDHPKVYAGTDLEKNIQFVNRRFEEAVEEFLRSRYGQTKVFFIDGHHWDQGPQKDFEAIESHLTSNDYVIFHDVRLRKSDVPKLVNQIHHENRGWIIRFNLHRGIAIYRK
jgi:predicted O-methyltransferase YrrM